MSLFRGIIKNSILLTCSNVGGRLLIIIFIAILARSVGPSGIGIYSFALSLIAVFMVLPNFGFDTLIVREIAISKNHTRDYITKVLIIKLLLTSITAFLLIIFIALRKYNSQTTQIILFVFAISFFGSIISTFYSIFRAYERMELEAGISLINNLLRLFMGLSAIKIGMKLNGIVFSLLIAEIFTFLLVVYKVCRNFPQIRFKIGQLSSKKILLSAIPFGIMSLMEIIFINTDNLMIARLQGEVAVGWYAAASKILIIINLVPSMFWVAILPVLSRISTSSLESLQQTYSKSFSYLLMLSFPIAIGGFMISDQIILTIYGNEFRNSILILQVMIWLITFSFVGYINGATLCATGRERVFAIAFSLIAFANILLDYVFIKKYGYIGACYVTLILKGIEFLIYTIICHKQLSIKPEWKIIINSMFSSVIMGAVIFFFKKASFNLFVLIPMGIVIFFGLIFLLGTLPKEDYMAFRNLVYGSSK